MSKRILIESLLEEHRSTLPPIDRLWPADGKAPRTQSREDELVALGSKATTRGLFPRRVPDVSDASWRSELFSRGRKIERGEA